MEMNEEQVMDAAIGAALAGDMPGTAVEAGDEETRRTERGLRETVARLAAASPHMRPSPELRARILEASAPRNFKLEDYRKVGTEDFRWYKWGFYAAAAFLVLGAMYNISVSNKLQEANSQVAAIQNKANGLLKQQQEQFALASRERDAALNAFIDLNGLPMTFTDNTTGKPFGRGIVNLESHKALIVLPQDVIASKGAPQALTMKDNNGKEVAFHTTVIVVPTAPDLVTPVNGPAISDGMPIQLVPDDKTSRPQAATLGGH